MVHPRNDMKQFRLLKEMGLSMNVHGPRSESTLVTVLQTDFSPAFWNSISLGFPSLRRYVPVDVVPIYAYTVLSAFYKALSSGMVLSPTV